LQRGELNALGLHARSDAALEFPPRADVVPVVADGIQPFAGGSDPIAQLLHAHRIHAAALRFEGDVGFDPGDLLVASGLGIRALRLERIPGRLRVNRQTLKLAGEVRLEQLHDAAGFLRQRSLLGGEVGKLCLQLAEIDPCPAGAVVALLLGVPLPTGESRLGVVLGCPGEGFLLLEVLKGLLGFGARGAGALSHRTGLLVRRGQAAGRLGQVAQPRLHLRHVDPGGFADATGIQDKRIEQDRA